MTSTHSLWTASTEGCASSEDRAPTTPTTPPTLTTGPQGTSLVCPAGTSPVLDRTHTSVQGSEFKGIGGTFSGRRDHTHIGCEPIKK
jgi:hypothetical protein